MRRCCSGGSRASGCHLIRKVPLSKAPGGAEYFDHISDADARRVYESHGSEIKILDADTFSVISQVETIDTAYGAKTMALDPKTRTCS